MDRGVEQDPPQDPLRVSLPLLGKVRYYLLL